MSKFIELNVNGYLMMINTEMIECVEPYKLGNKTVSKVYFKSKNPILSYTHGATLELYEEVKNKLL